jgi:hypothetical protein
LDWPENVHVTVSHFSCDVPPTAATLAKWVKKNRIEHWGISTVEMRDVEYATLEKEGFKRIDAGIYSAGHSAKIYHGVRTREVHFYPHNCGGIDNGMARGREERIPRSLFYV